MPRARYQTLEALVTALTERRVEGTFFLDNDEISVYNEDGTVLLYSDHPESVLTDLLDILNLSWDRL